MAHCLIGHSPASRMIDSLRAGNGQIQRLKTVHFAELYGVKWDIVTTNPIAAAEPPRVQRTKIEIRAPDEIKAVVDALGGRPLYPVAVIGLATGMRRGELPRSAGVISTGTVSTASAALLSVALGPIELAERLAVRPVQVRVSWVFLQGIAWLVVSPVDKGAQPCADRSAPCLVYSDRRDDRPELLAVEPRLTLRTESSQMIGRALKTEIDIGSNHRFHSS